MTAEDADLAAQTLLDFLRRSAVDGAR